MPPLYITEFVLDVDSLTFNPDLEEFKEIVSDIMREFKGTLLKVQNLVPDPYFDPFTRFLYPIFIFNFICKWSVKCRKNKKANNKPQI